MLVSTKQPSNRLCLVYEFSSPVLQSASTETHQALGQKAAIETGICNPESVRVKAIQTDDNNDTTLQSVHHMPWDPDFHVQNGGPVVRYEFVYHKKKQKLFVRIVTSLGDTPEMIIDGVTASRLAFHIIELLEGYSLEDYQPWRQPPEFRFTWRHGLSLITGLVGVLTSVLLGNLRILVQPLLGYSSLWGTPFSSKNMVVNSTYRMFQFYKSQDSDEPSSYQVFSSTDKSFRDYLVAVNEWKTALSLKRFFYLNNFSPHVAPGITNNIQDMANVQARYRGIYIPPGPGPPPNIWPIFENARMASMVFVNNYGRHAHQFQAKPVSYIWDWQEMGAFVHGTGCITINGIFLGFIRSLPLSLDYATTFRATFGDPILCDYQNVRWFQQMGPWEAQTKPMFE